MDRMKLKWEKEMDYVFYKDGKKIDIKQWNTEMNKIHPMSIREKHFNPIVRIEEQQRKMIILDMAKRAIQHINPNPIIADVGCEEGNISIKLLPYSQKLYCIDIDKNLLEIAKRRINSERAEFIESDAQMIKLPSESVDIALSSHVLEHLPNPIKGLGELARITKPNGRIVLNVPNEKTVLFIKKSLRILGLGFILGKLSTDLAPGHLHIFDETMLSQICKDNAIINTIRTNYPFNTNIFAELTPIK